MNQDLGILLEEYKTYEQSIGYSPEGLAHLGPRVKKLFTYLSEYSLSLTALPFHHAQGYQTWLLETGRNDGGSYSPGTIHNYLKAARRFFDFLRHKGMVLTNPFTCIKKIRSGKALPKDVLKEEEMSTLLDRLAIYDTDPLLLRQAKGYKIHVIAELLYATGLRAGEAARLRLEDVDLHRGTVTVAKGKNGKGRICFLNDYAREVLELYITKIRDLLMAQFPNRDKRLLFGVKEKTLITIINTVVGEAAKELEFPHQSSHHFRHAFGAHFLRGGCDLRFIQTFLGHESIGNTEVYTKIEKEDLKEVLDHYHPRQWRHKANGTD